MEPFTKALLDRAKSLVGGALQGVHYVDRTTEPGLPPLDRVATPVSHVGVVLLVGLEVVRIFSSNEFTDGSYELSLGEGPMSQDGGDVVATPVDDQVPWCDLVGRRIESSKIHWVDSPYVALSKRRKVFSSHHFDVDGAIPFSGPQAPLALELRVDNGAGVLLVSGGWNGVDRPIVETGSGISVLWDVDDFATLVPRIARELKKSW